MNAHVRTPGLFWSLVPIVVLVVLLVLVLQVFEDSVAGPAQIVLILSGFLAAIIGHYHAGVKWATMERQVLRSIGYVAQAILILLLVGALIGTWILGGIVPTLIVWGLKILSPPIYLSAAAIISAIVSLANGSSWSTAGTIGVALVGIGETIGVPVGMSAGAVISGAYFGDKLSPFSETTNLAASMAGTQLFDHIRGMLTTTVPSMGIALLVFSLLGFWVDSRDEFDPQHVQAVMQTIDGHFNTSIYILLPLPILLVLVARRVPAIPALIVGSLMGVLFAALFQGSNVRDLADGQIGFGSAVVAAAFQSASTGFVFESENTQVNQLLSKGGMQSMLTTIWLILSAMFFSGVMEGCGMLERIARAILSVARTPGQLIAATIATATFMNATASEQYLSIVLTGRMYDGAFEREELHERNLSRALEDGGTITSALFPWNTCGAYMHGTLGVSAVTYGPFAILNWLNPIIAIVFALLGVGVKKKNTDKEA